MEVLTRFGLVLVKLDSALGQGNEVSDFSKGPSVLFSGCGTDNYLNECTELVKAWGSVAGGAGCFLCPFLPAQYHETEPTGVPVDIISYSSHLCADQHQGLYCGFCLCILYKTSALCCVI